MKRNLFVILLSYTASTKENEAHKPVAPGGRVVVLPEIS